MSMFITSIKNLAQSETTTSVHWLATLQTLRRYSRRFVYPRAPPPYEFEKRREALALRWNASNFPRELAARSSQV